MPSCHGGRRAYTALLAVLVSCTMHGIAHAQPEQTIQSEQSAHKSEQSTQSMPSSLLPVDLETMAATPQLFPGAMTTQGEQGLEHGQKGEVHEEDLSQLVHSIGPQVMGGSSGEMDDLLTYQHCQQEVSSCTSLQFYQAGLTSTIPTTIGLLTALTNLVLQFNFLKGPLPSQLGLLTNLKTLYIANNAELDGSIPSQLAQLGSLKVMNLGSNALTGAVPSEIFSMNSLETLVLNKNHLTGTIPTEVGNAASLKVLSLSDNQLTGSVPEEIGHMNRLATCWLQNNQLTGSVPNSMSSLHSMQDFRIYENVGVCGSLPGNIVGHAHGTDYWESESHEMLDGTNIGNQCPGDCDSSDSDCTKLAALGVGAITSLTANAIEATFEGDGLTTATLSQTASVPIMRYSLAGMTALVVVAAVIVGVLRRKETPLELSAAAHSPRVGELRSYQGATYATVATAEP